MISLKQVTFLLAFVIFVSGNDVIVNTKSGKIAGKEVSSILPNEKYYSFIGIPFAEPPINELRFKAPVPHSGWEHVLQCKKEKPACAQYFRPSRAVRTYGFFGDEDCLHLSVHTPRLPNEEKELNLPVIVFLFNEQFKVSYNGTKEFTPDFFMSEDVIVVEIKHRLGALGFLSYEDDLLPGNNGIRDVILGLQWFKDNAKFFGANPDKITMMGNQGGAALIDILLYSPKAKGLFTSAILQSGTSWNSVYFGGKARHRAQELAKTFDLASESSSTVIKNLADIHAANITENEMKCVHADEARAQQVGIPAFVPVIEHDHPDAIITKLPEDSDMQMNIPIMIGYNSREGIGFTERYLTSPQYLTFADRDFLMLFPVRVGYHFKINDKVYIEAVNEIKEFYFEEGYIQISKPGEYITYMGDVLQFYPIDYTVRQYTNKSKAPVYYYTFDYSGELNLRKKASLEKAANFDGSWGASVADELCYLFVCTPIRKSYVKALEEEDSEEITVMQNMIKLWTNFIKYGNPTPSESEFKWTPATSENKECLLINEDLQMTTNLHSENVQFWDNFIEKHRKKAVNGIIKDLKDEL